MLSTCCISTKTVLVLLIAAATLQLGVASPIVCQETCFSAAEINLRVELFVAQCIVDDLVSFKVCATISVYE